MKSLTEHKLINESKFFDLHESIDNVENVLRKSGLDKSKSVEIIAKLDDIRQYINGNIKVLESNVNEAKKA